MITSSQLANIPAELKEMKNWSTWRKIDRDGKLTKVPRLRTNEPHKWKTFDEARKELLAKGDAGLAFLLPPGYCGLDFDDCIKNGELTPGRETLLKQLGTYAEISPSGNGVKCIGRIDTENHGNLSKVDHSRGIEIYDGRTGRFFAMTGMMVDGYSHVKDITNPTMTIRKSIGGLEHSGGVEGLSDEQLEERFGDEFRRRKLAKAYLAALPDEWRDERDKWYKTGMCLHATDDSLFDVWNDWSSGSSKYLGEEDCKRTWDSFHHERKNRLTMASLRLWAKEYGFNEAPFEQWNIREVIKPVRPSGRYKFEPVVSSQLSLNAPEIAWLWDGYVAKEHITLLVGLWKAGKTTLLSHILSMSEKGGELGGVINPCKVLVITEESDAIWAKRHKDLGIADNVHFASRPFAGKPNNPTWEMFCDEVAAYCVKHEIEWVIIDPWQHVDQSDNENEASQMSRALSPLHILTEVGCGVLITHHPTKGQTTRSARARGSGVLTGFVDIIVEFGTVKGSKTKRKLDSVGRFETPQERVVDYQEGEGYSLVEKKDEQAKEEFSSVASCFENGEWKTVKEIQDLTGVKDKDIRKELKSGFQERVRVRSNGAKEYRPENSES